MWFIRMLRNPIVQSVLVGVFTVLAQELENWRRHQRY